MGISRRHLLLGTLAAAYAAPLRAAAPRGLDATGFGVHPDSEIDQSANLQRAIERAAAQNRPLWLKPGRYRVHGLTLPSGAQIEGERGQTRLLFEGGENLFSAKGVERVALSGLTLEGNRRKLAENGGLLSFAGVNGFRIADCIVTRANGNALSLFKCDGAVTGNGIADAADNAVFALDSQITIRANTISGSGNGGIRVWRSRKESDASVIEDNTIEDTQARAGGDGQNGNAINIYRAANVIVRDNVIRRAAFTAVRGNAASHIKITGNQCFALGEVAIYSEFDFEDAAIENNLIDIAAVGIAVTNMDQGGHGAVVRNNIIRNMVNRRPQGGPNSYGLGIGIEADTEVSGNTIENATVMGIEVGSGKYLRNVTVTHNTVRKTGIGIGVTVVDGAGQARITDNVIADTREGAVVGMRWDKPATGDLTRGGTERFPNLTVADNQVR